MLLSHRLDQQLREPRVMSRERLPAPLGEQEELLRPPAGRTRLAWSDEAVAHQRSQVLANRGARYAESLPKLIHRRAAFVPQQLPEQLPAAIAEYLDHVGLPLIGRTRRHHGDAIRSD